MRLMVNAIGRLKDGAERDLVRRYAKRIDAAGRPLGIGPLSIVEVTESRLGTAPQRRDAEAQSLLGKLPGQSAHLVLLDAKGRQVDSDGFAQALSQRREAGSATLVFAIGGPDGHGEALRKRADETLSLGRLTLPHGLVRIVLVEQVYRALTILTGHPYHRA